MVKMRFSKWLAAAGMIGAVGLGGCRTSGGYDPSYRTASTGVSELADASPTTEPSAPADEQVAPDPDAQSAETAPYEEPSTEVDPEPAVAPSAPKTLSAADAVAAIREWGGSVRTNDSGDAVDVDLSGAKLTDADLATLAPLTTLEQLSLRGTEITDAGLRELASLDRLQLLDLGRTRITDAGLRSLRDLSSLQYLLLGNTRITSAGLVELQALTNLQGLSLVGVPLSSAALAQLQAALPNCQIVADAPAADDEAATADPAPEAAIEEAAPLEPVPAAEEPETEGVPGPGSDEIPVEPISQRQPVAPPEHSPPTAAASELTLVEDSLRYRRGLELARSGDVDEAFAEFSLVMSDADARYTLGVVLYRNALELSEQQFLEALELDPNNGDARSWVGEVRRQRLRMPHALDPMRIAASRDLLPLPTITPNVPSAPDQVESSPIRQATAGGQRTTRR